MVLIQGWVGAAVLAVAFVLALLAWWAGRPRRDADESVLASGLDRIRALPGFRALARSEWNRRRVEAACLTVALLGAALMSARLVGVGDDAEEFRTREVVLCLDVSGSMTRLDADVIDTYLELVGRLREERIGFVMFDAYAVTVFPLTNDREYVADQLLAAKESIAEPGDVAGTTSYNVGSSLIGDGLASCVQHFDQLDAVRSRTVVLATDNEVAGDTVYTTPEAARIAEDSDVMVFAIMPESNDPKPREELFDSIEPTGGEVLSVVPGESTNVARISTAIMKQQKHAILATAQDRTFDRVWPGALLFLLGLAGSLATVWRRS